MNVNPYAAPGCIEQKTSNKNGETVNLLKLRYWVIIALRERRIKKKLLSNRNDTKKSDYALFTNVCDISGHKPKDVIKYNTCRKREYVLIRQITMSLLLLKNKRSLTYAAGYFSKDHSTTIHSVKTVKNLMETDRDFKEKYGDLFKGITFPVYGNY